MSWWENDPVFGAEPRARITVRPEHGDAISSIESGGRYDALGPLITSGSMAGQRALGKYQVMESNVGPWTEKYFGQKLTPQQFLKSKEAQDAVFNGEFGRLSEKHGPEGAARAWFAGEGGMNDPNRKDQLGTTVAQYGQKFTKAAGSVLSGMGTQPAIAQEASRSTAWWDNDPPATPAKKVGAGAALLEGARSGVTANFSDEAVGASAAAATPAELKNPFDFPSEFVRGLAQLGFERIAGEGGASQRYAERRDEVRASQKASKEQYPVTSAIGEMAGAIALPVGPALQAATLPARMGRGAAVGATYGGLSGAGEGQNIEERAGRGAAGLGLGALAGAAAPPIVEGVIQAGRAVAAPVGRAIRGAMNPEGEAARRVVGALQRDAAADPGAVTSLTPQEFVGNVAAGGPARIMDMGGETTRGLARSAANTSPEARGLLNRAIDDRFEGQSERLTNWLNTTFNYPNAMAQQMAIQNTARTVNRPAYHRAYREGLRVPLWNAELEQLAQAPELQAAIRIAIPQLRNWAVRDGFAPPTGAFQIINGRTTLQTTPNGNTVMPSLQMWDYVKRALDQMGTPTAQAFSRALRTQLDDLVPSYQQARQGAAHFFGAEDALEAGQNFVTQRFDMRQTRAALANMSQEERQLFQDGFVSRYVEMLNTSGDRRNILNRIADSPTAREQLEVALGRQRANEMEGMLRVEGIMDLARGAVQGNSTTARQLAELGFAGGAGSLGAYGAYNMDPTQMAYGAVMGALLAGGRRIDSNLAQVVARQLTSNDPRVLEVGLRLLARNNRMMDNLRSVDRRIAASGSEQVPTNFAVQSLGAGRAEQGEPEVPGPRGQ
jgi:hypothetical protein